MRGAASLMLADLDDPSHHVTLKIWSRTGSTFEDSFSIDGTTFADVKLSAIHHLISKNNDYLADYARSSLPTSLNMRFGTKSESADDADNYRLISIGTKRTVDERKTLVQERVKDGDEYLLANRLPASLSKPDQKSTCPPIDESLIEERTDHLSSSSHLFQRDYRFAGRTEFRTDLNCILTTLIETSQKLLWSHPDAEQIFKQAEDILSRSSVDESTATSNSTTSNTSSNETRQNQISKLTDMGFTERQAQIALKRTRNDMHAAMELLLVQPDINDDETIEDVQEEAEAPPATVPLYSRHGPFVSFRQYRQQRFQPNPKAIQSLKEMGFNHNDIVAALRSFNNDRNAACEYLLGDRQQQQTMVDADNEQGLDPNSSMFQAIIQNPLVQRTLNSPKTFFVMLKISENPGSIANYLNDPEIGNMLLQISRIYHAERDQLHTETSQRRNSAHQDRSGSRTTESVSGDYDNDSD